MRHLRRAGTREVILGVMSVVVIGFAIYWFVTHISGKEAPPAGTVGFYCPRCQKQFKLTNDQWDKVLEGKKFKTMDRGQAVYECINCKQYVAIRWDESNPPPTNTGGAEPNKN